MKRPSNLLSPVLALLAALALAAVMMGADDPQATKPAGGAALSGTPPMIIHNPDGTFTIQKAPHKDAKVTNPKKGLVIPPQVVVPIIPAREKSK